MLLHPSIPTDTRTPATMLSDLVGIAKELTEVLETESGHLEAMDSRSMQELAPRKAVLSESYERLLLGLKSQAEGIAILPDAIREGARRASEKLMEATKRNELALKAMAKANERLVRTVVRAMEDRNPRTTGYDQMGNRPHQPVQAPMSVRFNETL